MSLYEGTHQNAASGSKAGLEYLLVYGACFAAYLLPVAMRRLNGSSDRAKRHRHSILGETSALAANCASSSFVGL
ncbi:hypothetical protein [Bradyrhizobium guangzhouense]|uniref:Uncharacterized protein n=1 Tax=Bradyrhizobium guangzhouense TaxID=1325095 RepID=A0AAE6C684_9BRAD|nr:hypothetical protein [Bradyrhizobium guangzhouense]QAU44364.1 hypothetical protein XH91_02660 [Bradyrhizobium guangzhouense]RXH10066.1 hypothetical protein EAS56_24320 [Bradyrhizobium guangzhouense]